MDGIINFNKPPGISSAGAVGRVKRLIPRGTKIGHAGTLDPFATGVLLLLVGKATRQCESLMDCPKQYLTTLKLGFNTETDDPESPEMPYSNPAAPPDLSSIMRLLPQFVGTIQQTPPVYSAMKVGGRRAYKLARAGQAVILQPRSVSVYGIELLDYTWPLLQLKIDCGRGTYIRAMARDIGHALGTGAYLTQLCRTRIGEFDIAGAVTLEQLSSDGVQPHLQPIRPASCS